MTSTGKVRVAVVWLASLLPLVAPVAMAQTSAVSARTCLNDLREFSSVLHRDGYWLEGSGYGYPMFDYGYAYGGEQLPATAAATPKTGYWRARPGYEVRTLLATADILGQLGKQASCEMLLATTRAIHAAYTAELRRGDVTRLSNPTSWRRREIEGAVAVTDTQTARRADQLVGTSVVNREDEALGTVVDIVIRPATGKIAYLVIGWGAILGIGTKYVPIPWADFKATPAARLLVLATTANSMENAPRIEREKYLANGSLAVKTLKVDDYWARHLNR